MSQESRSWLSDVHSMHEKFNHLEIVSQMTPKELKELLDFRIRFLEEELAELKELKSGEDIVDALVDLTVVALGTLDLFQIDGEKAWLKVHQANMAKMSGPNNSRPNSMGLPDLVKPDGWIPPDHSNNIGSLNTIFPQEISNDA